MNNVFCSRSTMFRAPWFAVLALSLITVGIAAQAQDNPGLTKGRSQGGTESRQIAGGLTLEDALQEALAQNQRISSAEHGYAAARDQLRGTRAKLYGELDAVISVQALNDAQLLRPLAGPVSPTAIGKLPFAQYQLHTGLTYNYPLFVGGKLAYQIEISRLGATIARLMLAQSKADTIYNVTTMYVEAVALAKQQTAVTAEIRDLHETQNHVSLAVSIGKSPGVDLLKVTDRLEESRARLTSIVAQQTRVLAMLSAMLGRDGDHMVTIGDLPVALPVMTVPPSVLLVSAAHANSVISANAVAAQAHNGVGVARADLLPTVQLQLSYFQHTDPGYPMASQETWFIGLQVGMPLMDGGSRRSGLARAKQQSYAADAQAREAKLETEAQLKGAIADWDAAQQQLTATDAQLKAANEVARIEQLRYDTGAGNIEDLLRARTRQTSAESNHIDAKAAVFLAAAEINHVVDQEVVK